MTSANRDLHIDIYSDVVCPWCYVGKRRLEQALETTGLRDAVAVQWRPFQLNPTMPQQGMDRRVYMEAKFGSAQEIAAIHDRLSAVGRSVGIEFAFDRVARAVNTFQAHRLIRYAATVGGPSGQDRQDRMVEALFAAYFLGGRNIGELDTLAQVAGQAGLDGETVRRFLSGRDDVEAVREEEARGRHLGIRGVPFFVIQGPGGANETLSGAQPPEIFTTVLQQMSRPT